MQSWRFAHRGSVPRHLEKFSEMSSQAGIAPLHVPTSALALGGAKLAYFPSEGSVSCNVWSSNNTSEQPMECRNTYVLPSPLSRGKGLTASYKQRLMEISVLPDLRRGPYSEAIHVWFQPETAMESSLWDSEGGEVSFLYFKSNGSQGGRSGHCSPLLLAFFAPGGLSSSDLGCHGLSVVSVRTEGSTFMVRKCRLRNLESVLRPQRSSEYSAIRHDQASASVEVAVNNKRWTLSY